MRLANRTQVPPPPHFRYRHPVSGAEFTRNAWFQLRDDVTAHTKGNHYPDVSDEEIEQQMCENMGADIKERFCIGDGQTVRGGLHWKDILQGTATLASFLVAGRPLVEQAEAERRASICAKCPRNVTFSKPCGGLCEELQSVVKTIVGGNGTTLDAKLESCSVCKCHLKSKVWVPLDILKKHDAAEHQSEYPDACWLKTHSA